MPDPVTGTLAFATLAGTAVQSRAVDRAAGAQERAGREGISAEQFALAQAQEFADPFRQLGLAAATPILQSLGIEIPTEFIEAREASVEGARTTDDIVEANIPLEARIGEINSILAQRSTLRPAQQLMRRDEFEALERERATLAGQIENNRSLARVNERSIEQQTAAEQAQIDTTTDTSATQGPDALLQQVNPLVSFLREEGFEDIQESAAAQGRLRSGGTLEDLARFNTQLASTVVPQLQQQRFNQLFNLLGLGANVAVGQGTQQLQTATNVGNLLGGIGQAQAGGILGQNQAIQGGISGLAGLFGAQQAGLFNQQPMTQGGLFNTGAQTDIATGAVSSPTTTNFGGF